MVVVVYFPSRSSLDNLHFVVPALTPNPITFSRMVFPFSKPSHVVPLLCPLTAHTLNNSCIKMAFWAYSFLLDYVLWFKFGCVWSQETDVSYTWSQCFHIWWRKMVRSCWNQVRHWSFVACNRIRIPQIITNSATGLRVKGGVLSKILVVKPVITVITIIMKTAFSGANVGAWVENQNLLRKLQKHHFV